MTKWLISLNKYTRSVTIQDHLSVGYDQGERMIAHPFSVAKQSLRNLVSWQTEWNYSLKNMNVELTGVQMIN